MEITTIVGLLLALIGIVGGNLVEGGHIGSLIGGPAFMIVVLGSLGAVLVATPKDDVVRALRALRQLFIVPKHDLQALVDKILELANLARREGLLALESHATNPGGDPFLVKCLSLAIDGSSADAIRDTMEVELQIHEEDGKAAAKFWENWGALSPTIGVLGAVLGLMHVMANLNQPERIGPGIAVAFVATVYGVGYANVVALPFSAKLKRQLEHEMMRRRMVLEGVIAIQSGTAPGALRSKLGVFLGGKAQAKKKA
jgi:chemotaxis protein MotA